MAEKIDRDESLFEIREMNGFDLDLIRENLKLTPEERVEKHRRACEQMLMLQRAGEAARRPKSDQSP